MTEKHMLWLLFLGFAMIGAFGFEAALFPAASFLSGAYVCGYIERYK